MLEDSEFEEEPSVWGGFVMSPQAVYELSGQDVHPEVFSIEPTGNLIHVLVEEQPEEYGNIILPQNISRENMGVGYIIAAGPMAGNPGYSAATPSPIGVIRDSPLELLGLHVIFSQTVGMPLRVSMLDRAFRAAVLVMQAKDIRGIDNNSEQLTKRAERRSKE